MNNTTASTPSLHRFGPAHTSGAFGSPLSWLQVATLLIGLYAAYRVFASTGIVGMAVAVGIVFAVCMIVFVPVRGREPIEWLPLILFTLGRRVFGKHHRRSNAPLAGFSGTVHDPSGPGAPPPLDLPPDLKHIELIEAAFDRHQVGVIKDRQARTYSVVLKVRVGAFGLLSTNDQQRRVEAWSGLLTNLCREGTPISRLQWIERTIPTDPDELVRYHLGHRDSSIGRNESVVQSYESLINDSTAATQDHELFLVVQISVRRAKQLIKRLAPNQDEGACLLLQQELQAIADALVSCDIEPLGVLKPRTLAKHIRLAYDPFQRRALDRLGAIDPASDGVSAVNAFPLASRTAWDHYQTDGALHATYWIAELPRRDVPFTFLLPLLLQANMQRSIAVVMEPLEISKALSKVEAAIVGDQTSEHVRRSKGFATTARRAKHSNDLLSRESELAAGYGEFRYSGYVTVSASTHQELEQACAAMENRALQSRLQLRRMNGMQDLAFSNTLPLARGLSGAGGAR
jgi:hypothetical protein